MIEFLTATIDSALRHNFVESDNYTFRGSQLPYCATRDFLSICLEKTNRLPKKLVPFFLLNTAETGTAMHKTLQRALAGKNMIFGNWKCYKCKKTLQMSMAKMCCGDTMEYRELHLQDAVTGFSGHADAVVPYADGYLLVDFKTKDPKKLKSVQITTGYRFQVAAYRYFLTREPFNLKIIGTAIVYLGREDRPNFRILELVPDELADLEFDRFRRQRCDTVEAVKTGDVSRVHKLCRSSGDSPYCPFQHCCFGPQQHQLQAYLKTEWDKFQSAQHTTTAT